MIDNISWLQAWYAAQCNGDWEHGHSLLIQTIDNPGWRVDVRVEGTSYEGLAFDEESVDRSETDWVWIQTDGLVVKGRGGALNLAEILSRIRFHMKRHAEVTS